MPTPSTRNLTIKEQEVYKKLLAVVEARKSNNVLPRRVMVITDIGKDYDDLAAMLVLKEFHRLGLIHLEGFIANMKPSGERAVLGRVVLDLLGLQDVPIGVGTDGPKEYCKAFDYEFEASFMPDEGTFTPKKDKFFKNSFGLLDQVLTRSVPENPLVDFLIISSPAEVVQYTKRQPGVFQHGVGKVYMQGSYSVSAAGIPIPREDAANNFNDMAAAKEFHDLIAKKIPSVVYTRIAAFAAKIPAEIFIDLEASQHPIGSYLRKCHAKQDVTYYKQACSDKPYKDVTQQRFLETKTNFFQIHRPGSQKSPNGTPLPLDETPLPVGDQITPYLTFAVVYDALPAFHIGGEDVATAFGVLDADSMANQTSIHKVVGTPKLRDDLPEVSNINPEQMIFVISTLLKGALYDSMQ